MKPLIYLSLAIFLLGVGCSTQTELVTIKDNTPIPDVAVSLVVKETYVNKLYISLLGRKPSEAELFFGISILNEDNASVENRNVVMDKVLDNPEFPERMYEISRIEMLNNIDTTDISVQIYLFTLALNDPLYQDFIPLIQTEIAKLVELRDIPKELADNTLMRPEMHRRMAFNSFYDEINMGSQNYVLSLFEYFFDRYPTQAEEVAAITMVEGFNSLIFNQEGSIKEDFVDIFFTSDDYYEGQVVDLYNDYLRREPTSQEMSTAAVMYKQTGDYKLLLKQVLTKDEYLGI